MKLLWIIFLSVCVALGSSYAQETPSPTADQAPAEEKADTDPPSAEATPSPSPSATPSTEQTASIEETKEAASSEIEVPPETAVEDLPSLETDSTGLESAASGPDVPVSPPDTSFMEPDSHLNFGEDHASAMEEATLPPPARNIAEEERQQRLRYQKARVQALKDPEVIKAKETAEKAKTPEDYRANYRLYYNLLYDKIAKIDPSLENYSFSMKAAHIHRLAQSRILPTIPNNPPPTPVPSKKN